MSSSVNQRDSAGDSDQEDLQLNVQSYQTMVNRSSYSENYEIRLHYPGKAFSLSGWGGLSEGTQQNVFSFLPLPSLLVCGTICRHWCNVLNNPALYTHLDLSPYGTVMRDKDYAHVLQHPRYAEIRSLSIAYCYDFPPSQFLHLRKYIPKLEYLDVSNVVGLRPYLAEGLARLPALRGFDSTVQNGGATDETCEPGTLVEAVNVGRSIRLPPATEPEGISIPVVSLLAAHRATEVSNCLLQEDTTVLDARCPLSSVSVMSLGEQACIQTDYHAQQSRSSTVVTKGPLFAGLTWFFQCARTGRDAYAGTGVSDMTRDCYFDGTQEEIPREPPAENNEDDNIFNFEEDTAFQNLPPVSNVFRARCTYKDHSSQRQDCRGQVRGLVVWGLVNSAGLCEAAALTEQRQGCAVPSGEWAGIRKAYPVPLCSTKHFCYCHSRRVGGRASGFVCQKSAFCQFLPVAIVYVCHSHRPEITADARVYTCSMCSRQCSTRCDDGVVCYDCRLTSRKHQEWHFLGRESMAESNLMGMLGASSSIPVQQGVCIWKQSLLSNVTSQMQITGDNWGWFESLKQRVLDAQAILSRNNERRQTQLSTDARDGASIEMEGMHARDERHSDVYLENDDLDSDNNDEYRAPWYGIEAPVPVEEQHSEEEDISITSAGIIAPLISSVPSTSLYAKPVLDKLRNRPLFWRAVASGSDIELLVHPLPFTAGLQELCPPRTASVILWPLCFLLVAVAMSSRAYDHQRSGAEVLTVSPTLGIGQDKTDVTVWPFIALAVAIYIVGFCLIRICRCGPAVVNALKMTIPFLYTAAAAICGYIPLYCQFYDANIPLDQITFLLVLLTLSSSAMVFFLPITHCTTKRAAVLATSFIFGSAYGWVIGAELAYVLLFFICLLDIFDSALPQPRFPVVSAPHQQLFPTPNKGAYPLVTQGSQVLVELRPFEFIWVILAFCLSLNFPTVTQVVVFLNIISVFLVCTYVYPVTGLNPRPTPIIIVTTAIILLLSPLLGNIQRAMASAYTQEVDPPYMV